MEFLSTLLIIVYIGISIFALIHGCITIDDNGPVTRASIKQVIFKTFCWPFCVCKWYFKLDVPRYYTIPIMNEVEGISRQKESLVENVTTDTQDSKMSISHLLMKGYVETRVADSPFEVDFKSLTTAEVHEADSMVVVLYGVAEHRAAKNARYMKYLAKSVNCIIISSEGNKDNTVWDFTSLSEKAKEEALKAMSSFVFNKIFSMYVTFEGMVSDLIKSTEVKKS